MFILTWAAPPALGALVGWVIALIAARIIMGRLSRPASPLVARGRTAIARSLGRLAAVSIVTKESLQGLIRSPKTAEQVSLAVSSLTARIAATPVSRLKGFITAFPLQETIAAPLKRFLGSRAAIYMIRDLIRRLVDTVAARRMQDVLQQVDLATLMRDKLLPFIGQEANRRTLARSLGSIVSGQAGKVLSNEIIEELSGVIEPYVPAVADRIVQWLRSEETRSLMAEKGRVLLPQILEKLNVLQKLLISAGQFDRRLNERMPEIVDETVRTLEGIVRDPIQQRRIVRLLIEAAEDWRDGLLFSATDPRSAIVDQRKLLGQAIEHLSEQLLASLEDLEARGALAAAVEGWLTDSSQSVGGFLRSLGLRDVELADSLAAKALSWLTREDTARSLSRLITDLVMKLLEENENATLGDILQFEPSGKKSLDELLSSNVMKFADAHVVDIIARLDVEARVVDLVQGIDMAKALDTAGSRKAPVRWAAIFGALVGLLAGLSQLLLKLVQF
jgi:hypothetical protein